MTDTAEIELSGLYGISGNINTFMGFAPANLLYKLSFADILNEETGAGYQRRFSNKHSIDFRNYIQKNSSTTIPLAFNLRPELQEYWKITICKGKASLKTKNNVKVLSQVDCQHRLGYLADLEISLPFITFIGLTEKQEMETFNTINSKAKGLPGSLLDFHDTKLITNIENIKPELVLAVRLNDDHSSPWHKMLDLGGNRTSGMQRRASLRTMQKAIKGFLRNLNSIPRAQEDSYEIILSFWQTVVNTLPSEWEDPRKHMLCKGIGVYSLMTIAADIYSERRELSHLDLNDFFKIKFGSFAQQFDWTNQGPLKGLGGEAGVKEATAILRKVRRSSQIRSVKNG